MSAEQLSAAEAIPDEERARANVYALLGRLFYAAPDERLLAEIRAHDSGMSTAGGDDVSRAWGRLIEAVGSARSSVLQEEYEALFGGVGKALVTPYTSHYIKDTAPDKHLVALRETLAEWGMTRRSMTFEIEDHSAAICDVMRLLIERDQPLEMQKIFFCRFVRSGMPSLCDAIEGVESASFYRHVAELARAFLELENTAFDMVDS
jgi:TorA maturation chaperone TorD